ncbi:Uncharacterized protein FWK35_00035662, partial [Aphis craccivora]
MLQFQTLGVISDGKVYPWCIIEVKSKHFPTVFKKIDIFKKNKQLVIQNKIFDIYTPKITSELLDYTDVMLTNFVYVYVTNTELHNATVKYICESFVLVMNIIQNNDTYNNCKIFISMTTQHIYIIPPPSKDIEASLYLVGKDPYNSADPPFEHEIFDKHRHVYPDVLWFQPYAKNPSAINFSLTLGLLIESGDIDAVVIPIPNIWISLTENNSMYLQGSIPIEYINKFSPSHEENNRLRLCTRVLNADEDQPIGLAFRDCSTVMVPRFGTDAVRSNINQLYGVNIAENCNDPQTDFTYTAWRASDPVNLPNGYTHLWSSYRYVTNSNTKNRKVRFYYTLRQFYGENVTLSRTRNP